MSKKKIVWEKWPWPPPDKGKQADEKAQRERAFRKSHKKRRKK